MHIIFDDKASDDILSELLSRDAVLWITESAISNVNHVDAFVKLVNSSWRGVYVESSSREFSDALRQVNEAAHWSNSGGYLHLVYADPSAIVFPRKSCPVFLLNGREGGEGGESASLSSRSALRRRLNMVARLRDMEPKRVVVLGNNPIAAIEELAELWGTEFRSLVTIVTEDRSQAPEVNALFNETTDLSALAWILQSPDQFAETLVERAKTLSELSTILVNAKLSSGITIDIDLAEAELPEQPLSDAFEFIEIRDTLPVSPRDLSEEEFREFFTKAESTWRSFSADLPWIPDKEPEHQLIGALTQSLEELDNTLRLFSIASEPGAGGTTLARALAFSAAKAGFPTLLVKQQSSVPTALEITSFLYRAISILHSKMSTDSASNGEGEPVWLLVLDVQHLDSSDEDLWRFCAELARSGRKIVVLKVVQAEHPLQPPKNISHSELAYVNHELDFDTVASLGNHLNVFLRTTGREKSAAEWQKFWEVHRPDIDTGIASFWIALEFWLAGYLEMGETIQGWTLKQFRSLAASIDVKKGILEIAALSIERRAVPERLLAQLLSPRLPWSQVLDAARRSSPGIGLLQAQSVPNGRVWAIAHDVLARYLINAVWNDRILCSELGIEFSEDPVVFRLDLISKIAHRPAIGEPYARPLAIALATGILKIDEQSGNAEFFRHWKRVLSLLETMPNSIRNSSRTFNHHLAISRRRVTQGEIFHVSADEKRALLLKAANEVNFALERIDSTPEDESDLNLLNTLALLYQDLAGVERATSGDKSKLAEYLAKSDEFTRRALKENPNNSYVLETAAKNLLYQDYSTDENRRVRAAAEAISYVFQASSLETAVARRMKLGLLVQEAMKSLMSQEAEGVVNHLCSLGSSFGYVAKAWRIILQPGAIAAQLPWEQMQPDLAKLALDELRISPQRDWLLVRLQYDLEVLSEPLGYARQLALLDELADTAGYKLSMQQRLERAVLLSQQGRHKPAGDEFVALRRDVRLSQTILFVPDRLRWLLVPDRSRRAICSAHVIDSSSGKPLAQVTELAGTKVPFNPQEFAKARMAVGEVFTCNVTFSAMGPFLKAAESGQRRHSSP